MTIRLFGDHAKVLGAVVLTIAASCAVSGRASAATPNASWAAYGTGIPSELSGAIGARGEFLLIAENTGDSPSEQNGLTLRDQLPAGLTVTTAFGDCVGAGTREVTCEDPDPVPAGGFFSVFIEFEQTSALVPGSTVHDIATASGSGAPAAVAQSPIRVAAAGQNPPGPAGVSSFDVRPSGSDGQPTTQAASHPFLLTTSLFFNSSFAEGRAVPIEGIKHLAVYLPLGMIGNPTTPEQCPISRVSLNLELEGCPPGSRVGTILPVILSVLTPRERGIYNVTPEKGFAQEFAFSANNDVFVLYANVVRHEGQYMIRVSSPGIFSASSLIGFVTAFYGDIQEHFTREEQEVSFDRGAFLTNPSDCSEGPEAREASVGADTWEQPDASLPLQASTVAFPPLSGCASLHFGASLDVRPTTSEADTPSAYEVDVRIPQARNEAGVLATPPMKDIDVTLPAGTSVSPSSAEGLTACAPTGAQGINIEGSGSEEEGPDGLPQPAAGHCPQSSIIGTATARTPLLAEPLEGHLYLAEPECGNASHANACGPGDAHDGKLFPLYLELEAPERGVIIKLKGTAHADPNTGQLTTTFDDQPQFPVADIDVRTNGGPRASLENPLSCGTATSTGLVTSWSPASPSVSTQSSFNVEGCSSAFAPTLDAGTISPTAGTYAPFTLTLKREDREQNLRSLSTTLPPGLLAAVSHVSQCPEPQATDGGCPASSKVGTTIVAVGPGPSPLYETGQVYLTGPYKGAPFGLSVVVPAVAGPFNLGDVVVRVALHLDPDTTQVTAVSDAFPQILDGVPLRIRTINVTLDAPEFTLNPTNCAAMRISASAYSTQGATAALSSPFAATGCHTLPFKPVLTAFTAHASSRANGVSLRVRVSSGGGQANIAKVELQLPKQFPSRLSTLQKACTQAQFASSPAGCPQASNIGFAIAHTPLLNVPLTGPAYLVSHGGQAFPDVVFVLQGEGVRIDLTGHTQIKKGVTYSRFETVPDAPISSFEALLPQGPHSALGANLPAKANGSLCAQNLAMPTEIVGQNGATLKQTTKIAVTGCPKTKKTKRKSKSARHGKKKGR